MTAVTTSEAPFAEFEPPRPFPPKAWSIPKPARFFVELLITSAIDRASSDRPGVPPAVVDWNAIWSAGDGAPSVESALGRVVTAAHLAVREIELRHSNDGLFKASVVPSRTSPPTVSPPGRGLHSVPVIPVDASPVPPSAAGPQPIDEVWAPPTSPASETATGRPAGLFAEPPGWSTVFTWIRNIGAIAVLFVAWQLWGTSISQHQAQHQLQGTFEAAVHARHAPKATASGPVLIAADQTVPTPAEGSPVAQIQIPTIGLNEYVVSGTAESDLAKGPGHYIGTAAPGQAGNVAIAGHRTTNGAPFNRLGQLAVGNQIYLTTLSGQHLTYIVSQAPQAVAPNDVAVLDNFGDNRITLTTCNPEYSSAQRLVVVGELKQTSPPVVAEKTKPRAYHVVDSKTATWDWALLPIVVLEAGFLMLFGLTNRRFTTWFGGVGRWCVLVPLWAVGLYVLFETVTSFLPATI
jgi:sortase A